MKVVRCLIDAQGARLNEYKISGNCILYSDYFARDSLAFEEDEFGLLGGCAHFCREFGVEFYGFDLLT